AQGLDKEYSVHHAAAENVDGSNFVRESRALCGCYFKVAGNATFVTGVREFQIFLGSSHSFVLNLSFVFENPQSGYIVLNLLKAGEHGLAIIGDGLIIVSDGLV